MSTTAREALLAELIGDVAALTDRVDRLLPAINASCDALVSAKTALDAATAQLPRRIGTLTDAAAAHATAQFTGRAEELARRAADRQINSMRAAGQKLFTTELAASLKLLAAALSQQAFDIRVNQRWRELGATAIVASTLSCLATAWLLIS